MKQILLIVLAIGLLATSCNFVSGKRVRGNGNMTTAQRSETNFTGIASNFNFDTYVGIGPYSIRIEAEENIIPFIETYVENGVLKITDREGYSLRPRRDVKIYVTAPRLQSLYAGGNGDITSTTKITDTGRIDLRVTGNAEMKIDVDAPAVEAKLTGNGDIDIVGQTRDFQASTTGNGHIDAKNLQTENTRIEILGNGNAEVNASVKLDVRIGGNGNVRYKGNPQTSTNITGNGSLRKID